MSKTWRQVASSVIGKIVYSHAFSPSYPIQDRRDAGAYPSSDGRAKGRVHPGEIANQPQG